MNMLTAIANSIIYLPLIFGGGDAQIVPPPPVVQENVLYEDGSYVIWDEQERVVGCLGTHLCDSGSPLDEGLSTVDITQWDVEETGHGYLIEAQFDNGYMWQLDSTSSVTGLMVSQDDTFYIWKDGASDNGTLTGYIRTVDHNHDDGEGWQISVQTVDGIDYITGAW